MISRQCEITIMLIIHLKEHLIYLVVNFSQTNQTRSFSPHNKKISSDKKLLA